LLGGAMTVWDATLREPFRGLVVVTLSVLLFTLCIGTACRAPEPPDVSGARVRPGDSTAEESVVTGVLAGTPAAPEAASPAEVAPPETPALRPDLQSLAGATYALPLTGDPPPGRLYVTLFFADSELARQIPVTREIERTPAVLHAICRELAAGPAPGSGLLRPMSALGVEFSDGIAWVDFPRRVDHLQGSCSVQTLVVPYLLSVCAHPAVEKVGILVEGERREYTAHGLIAEPYPRGWSARAADRVVYALARCVGDRVYLVPRSHDVPRRLQGARVSDLVAYGMEKLVHPLEYGIGRTFVSVVPAGLRALGVAVWGETVFVNFNPALEEALSWPDPFGRLCLDAIVFTACRTAGVDRARLLVLGRPIDAEVEGLDLSRPLSCPRWLNPELESTDVPD